MGLEFPALGAVSDQQENDLRSILQEPSRIQYGFESVGEAKGSDVGDRGATGESMEAAEALGGRPRPKFPGIDPVVDQFDLLPGITRLGNVVDEGTGVHHDASSCLLHTSPSPRDS